MYKYPVPNYGILSLPVIVYCDMDGVLCNFWGTVKRTFGDDHTRWYQIDKKKFWEPINDEGSVFWEGLPWLPGARAFWEELKRYNPTILSARSLDPMSLVGKEAWINKHLGVETKRIICFRHEKAVYAAWDVANGNIPILYDDQERNVDAWERAGGRGILHRIDYLRNQYSKDYEMLKRQHEK